MTDRTLTDIHAELRAALETLSPEQAAQKVIAADLPLPPWAEDVMLDVARGLARQRVRRIEDRSFRRGSDPQQKLALAKADFALPDGRRYAWEDLTIDLLEEKMAWAIAQINSLQADVSRWQRAIDLLAAHPPGTRLGTIPGWQDAIADP